MQARPASTVAPCPDEKLVGLDQVEQVVGVAEGCTGRGDPFEPGLDGEPVCEGADRV